MVNIFWNRNQRRIRALWRLTGQLVLLGLIGIPLQLGVSAVVIGMVVAQGGNVLERLTNPQAVEQFLVESPLLMVLSTVTMLIAFPTSIWLAGRFLDRRPFADFGFHFDKGWWTDFGFGLLLGAFLMLVIFLVERAAGWLTVTGTLATSDADLPFPVALLPPLITFLAVGFYEELFSRGYHLRNLAEAFNWKRTGPRVAVLIATLLSSAVFGLLHLFNPNASFASTFNIAVTGVFLLGLGYVLTGELAIPIGVHITWNFFQGNVFGLPVSGLEYRWATFISIDQHGPELWTGGAFGPEAGLTGLGAVLLGGLLTALWVRWRRGHLRVHIALAEAPRRREKREDTTVSFATIAHGSADGVPTADEDDSQENPLT